MNNKMCEKSNEEEEYRIKEFLISSQERWLTSEKMEEDRLKKEKLKSDPEYLKSIIDKWKHVLDYTSSTSKSILIKPQVQGVMAEDLTLDNKQLQDNEDKS